MTARGIGDQAAALLAALDKLPPYQGLSYRGYTDGGPRRGTTISAGLVASSLDPRVATDNFTTPGVFAIIGNRGRDLSALSRIPVEREIVFRPGSMFLPIESFDLDGLRVSVIEELDPDRAPGTPPSVPLEQLEEQMRAEISAARRREPVASVTPGKFVGDLG